MRTYPRHLDWMRYIAAFLLFMYGSSKLIHLQFHMSEALAQRPVASLSGYELTWFYYGYSRTYACILGLTQIAGATFLLFRKTALLGAVTMLPVISNILLIDALILPPDYGPMIPAVIICLALTLIFRRDYRALLQSILTTESPEPPSSRNVHRTTRLVIVSVAVVKPGEFISACCGSHGLGPFNEGTVSAAAVKPFRESDLYTDNHPCRQAFNS